MMKKILYLLLAAAILFSACQTQSDQSQQPTVSQTPDETASEPTPETTAQPTPEPASEPVSLLISAAASLTDVITEIGEKYQTENQNVTLSYSFDSSGALQAQIEEGAPADIFLSAAQKQMNALADENLIEESTRLDLLVNKVVLIKNADSDLDITSFEETAGDSVKMIALGEASVPVGQYAEEIFTSLGIWETVSAKASFGTNVRAVLAWVEDGSAECGVVYATDAATTDKVEIIAEAPEGSHAPVVYPGAVVSSSQNIEEAKKFLDYLSSDSAREAFEKYGFAMVE
jgi:molybdate transport system substrate-binding protein